MDVIRSVLGGISYWMADTPVQSAVTVIGVAAMAAISLKYYIGKERNVIKPSITPFLKPQKQFELAPPSRAVSLLEGALPEIPNGLRTSIMRYLRGEADSDVKITAENYREVLHALKVIDLELDREANARRELKLTTYELRTCCLVVSGGALHSCEAYTKSINPKTYENPFDPTTRAYASRPENYVPERVRLHALIMQKYVVDCYALSKRLKAPKATLYVLRGNIGAGKTHMSRNDPELKRGSIENGDVTGTLAPDGVKALLRKGIDSVLNSQVHIEGYQLHERVTFELQNRAIHTSVVRDERFISRGEIAQLIDVARETGREVVIKDMDVPPILSALRVLARDVNTEPCIPLRPITDGIKAIRKERKGILDLVALSPEVRNYELFVTNKDGRYGLAARKRGAAIEIVDRELYEYAVSAEGAVQEVEAMQGTKINEELCRPFLNAGVKVHALLPFFGLGVEEALHKHATTPPQWKVG